MHAKNANSSAGITLVEILMASCVLAAMCLSLYQFVSIGRGNANRADELDTVSLIGDRLLDRILSQGYTQLSHGSGEWHEVSMATVGEPNARVQASYQIQSRSTDLVKITVRLNWRIQERAGRDATATRSFVRFVAASDGGVL